DVPPLRERREDIPILIRAFFDRYRTKHSREVEGIEAEAYRRLLSYAWPGNVRELQNALERALLVTRGPQITLEDFPEPLQRTEAEPGAAPAVAPSEVPVGSLEEIERASILRALETTKWNKQAAAALLGLRSPTLYSKMRKHGIPQRRGGAYGRRPKRRHVPGSCPFRRQAGAAPLPRASSNRPISWAFVPRTPGHGGSYGRGREGP